jgi:hypothetical protein
MGKIVHYMDRPPLHDAAHRQIDTVLLPRPIGLYKRHVHCRQVAMEGRSAEGSGLAPVLTRCAGFP